MDPVKIPDPVDVRDLFNIFDVRVTCCNIPMQVDYVNVRLGLDYTTPEQRSAVLACSSCRATVDITFQAKKDGL